MGATDIIATKTSPVRSIPPAPNASASQIVSFFADTATVLKAVMGIIPFPVIALFLFLAGSFPRFSVPSREATFWARVGAVGLVLVEVMFLARTTFELVQLAKAEDLAGEPALV